MPPEVEQPLSPDRARTSHTAAAPGPPPTADDAAAADRPDEQPADGSTAARGREHHHHHVLREPDEDRWRWRARIRQNPHQLRVYRGCVAVIGLLLILLGFVTGPLPGPGGIPLVLAGLAVWASEFAWAARLMTRFKRWLEWFRGLSRGRQVLVVAGVVAVAGLLGYGFLLAAGPPGWLPVPVERLLLRLPGV